MTLQLRAVAVSGFLAVALGAFGAHALKTTLDIVAIGVYETAVQYHFFHTIAALILAIQPTVVSIWLVRAVNFFIAGIVLFCGSLYALALTSISALGVVTPLGGVCFLLGWACIVAATRGAKNGR